LYCAANGIIRTGRGITGRKFRFDKTEKNLFLSITIDWLTNVDTTFFIGFISITNCK
jgi:hypothetical protein